MITSGPVPLNDVTRAVEEIEYAHDHLGIRCFWARPDQFNHRNLGDRYYDPIYEILQDLDCAFATHEYMGLNAPTAGSDRFDTFTEWHTVVHPHEAQCALLSMIVHGVFERFPRLRVAYMEAGCGWLPSWLHRIDEHLELAGAAEAPDLTMSATDYFRRNCWISTECDDRYVADVMRWMGDDHIVFETDFPHPDSKYPKATDHFLALEPDLIDDDSKRKVLWDNAVDLYRFPEGYLPVREREHLPPTVRGGRPRTRSRGSTRHRPSTSRPRGWPRPRRSSERSWSASALRAVTAAKVPFFARRWAEAGFDPATISSGRRSVASAGVHGRRHPPQHRGPSPVGRLPGCDARPTPARAHARVHVRRHHRPVATDLLHAVGSRDRRAALRPRAVHAGRPTRRRRAQLVGVRHAQRRVRLRRGAVPLARLRRASRRARAT